MNAWVWREAGCWIKGEGASHFRLLACTCCTSLLTGPKHLPLAPSRPLQFGSGYILGRLPLLSQRSDEAREEKARMLCLLGHLLNMYARFGVLRGRGVADMAKKVQTNVSRPLLVCSPLPSSTAVHSAMHAGEMSQSWAQAVHGRCC